MIAPNKPDQRALEDERPADEGVRGADQAHDLDLVGPRDDREPDRVHDDEQDDQAPDHEHDEHHRSAGCR